MLFHSLNRLNPTRRGRIVSFSHPSGAEFVGNLTIPPSDHPGAPGATQLGEPRDSCCPMSWATVRRGTASVLVMFSRRLTNTSKRLAAITMSSQRFKRASGVCTKG